MKPDSKSYPHQLPNGAIITIGHRPRKSLIESGKFTHFISLISIHEGVDDIERNVKELGKGALWYNFPLKHADVTRAEFKNNFVEYATQIIQLVSQPNANIYISCSAGIHRTGTVAYYILRYFGANSAEAMEILTKMRPVTALNIGIKRISFVETILQNKAREMETNIS